MRTEAFLKSNLHTHTRFCDGAHTPEEIVLEAIGKGMNVIGFSGHAYTPVDISYCMTPQDTACYRAEIERLKVQYSDRIKILLGLEQDLYSAPPDERYDYLIGSVHYVLLDGEYCAVDHSAAYLTEAVARHCGGDVYRFAREYYRSVAQIVDKTGCDIVGHFDLVTKFNEGGAMLDEKDPRYLGPALEALDALLEKDVVFEVNTGAMSRGYRRLPYPSCILLRRIAEKRGMVTLSSDAHRKEHLLYAFKDALMLLKASGFGSVAVMTPDGWKDLPL